MKIQKRLKNVYSFKYLMMMDKKIPSPKKAKAKQNRNVYKLMKRAYEIPFYRERFEASGTTPEDYHSAEDLAKFPLTNKADLRLWMQQEWDAHPEMHDDGWDTLSTSGSSGTPLRILLTWEEVGAGNANWVRILKIAGYEPVRGKMYSFLTSHVDPSRVKGDSIVQKFGFLRRKVVSELHCAGDGIADIINDINTYKPDMLCFRRNCLVRIALYAKQHNMPLWKPKWYVPVSEMVDENTVRLLHEYFGPGLIDGYGASETGCCVVKYPGKDYYDIMNDTHVCNIYDENDQLADNGRIILTTLYKKTFPIINYDVGDLGESYMKDGLRYVTKIQGRMNDLVKHESGMESSALELMKIANRTVGLAQFRFTQLDYHNFLVQMVADPNNTTRTKEENAQFFKDEVLKLYDGEFDLTVEWLDVLPADKTGKQRCFVCNVE